VCVHVCVCQWTWHRREEKELNEDPEQARKGAPYLGVKPVHRSPMKSPL
jgi:hypothetical protein